jgi:hypothetical protein
MRTTALPILLACALASSPATFGADTAKADRMRAVWQQFASEGNQLRTEFDNQLRAMRLDQVFSLLKGSTTPTRAALVDGDAKLATVQKRYAEFAPKYEKLTKTACDRLMAVDAREGRDCQAGLVNSPVTRQFASIQNYYGQWRTVLQFLASKSGTFALGGAGFEFKGKGDKEAYNRMIDQLVAMEEEVRASQQKGQEALERMQSQYGSTK